MEVEARHATTPLATSHDAAAEEPWNSARRTTALESPSDRSDPRRTPKRPSNRVKARPADPAVISSILTSLDALATPPAIQANDYTPDGASWRSLPESSSKSVASSASTQRNVASPGFGVEYGNALALDHEEGFSDAALPPTIATSRPPSGLSNYRKPKKPISLSSSTPKALLRSQPSSRRSSLSVASAEPPVSRKNKLSSESWVRNNSESDDRPASSTRTTARKSLRRVSSQEMLRQDDGQDDGRTPTAHATDSKHLSLAEQIIARTPPPMSSSKGRLYLTDATIDEDLPLEESSPSPTPTARSEHVSNPNDKVTLEDSLALAVGGSLAQVSSPISDSIPTRTSSLRQSSASPAGGRRNPRKSKRHTIGYNAKSERSSSRREKSIPDSSWADLGDDDETVRRIKELRQKRESRLLAATASEAPLNGHSDEQFEATIFELAAAPARDEFQTTSREPSPGYGVASSRQKAPQVQHREYQRLTPSPNNGSLASEQPGNSRRGHDSPSSTIQPSPAQFPPDISKSESVPPAPLGLEYSYSQAVYALDDPEQVGHAAQEKRSRESSDQGSVRVNGGDPHTPRIQTTTLLAPPQTKSSSKRTRGSPQHPDLPLDFEKKQARRKSMSDARNARTIEEQAELARRDSVEAAVDDYLSSPRLSRTVQNPITGRTIAFSEVGDPNGAAVFVCVGMGLTRYVTAFYDELAATLRLRLITLDRPGVGGSEPFPSNDKTGPLAWPEDVLAVCQDLGIVKFSILAHSAGAIYALATALILPHLVKGKVHLLAPWVPPSQLEAISHPMASAPPANPLPRSQRFLRVLPTPFLKAANSSFMSATSASLKPASKRSTNRNVNKTPPHRTARPGDVPNGHHSDERPEYNRRESMMLMDQFMPATHPLENFPVPVKEEGEDEESFRRGSLGLSATTTPTDPSFAYATMELNAAEHAERERQHEYASRLTQRTWDLATRDSNPATDLVVCLERNRDVGFRYTDVGREVVITHGSEDKRVPVANVKWLAEQMNRRAMGLNFDDLPRESRDSWTDGPGRGLGGCEVRILPGEGHGLMASPIIMGDVLTEIAGYQDKVRL